MPRARNCQSLASRLVHHQIASNTGGNGFTATFTCFLFANETMNVPYLHPRLPDSLKWRILGALLKLNQRPYADKTRTVILGALGAMNIAAACGVPPGREAIVANLLVGMVSDIEALAYQTSA